MQAAPYALEVEKMKKMFFVLAALLLAVGIAAAAFPVALEKNVFSKGLPTGACTVDSKIFSCKNEAGQKIYKQVSSSEVGEFYFDSNAAIGRCVGTQRLKPSESVLINGKTLRMVSVSPIAVSASSVPPVYFELLQDGVRVDYFSMDENSPDYQRNGIRLDVTDVFVGSGDTSYADIAFSSKECLQKISSFTCGGQNLCAKRPVLPAFSATALCSQQGVESVSKCVADGEIVYKKSFLRPGATGGLREYSQYYYYVDSLKAWVFSLCSASGNCGERFKSVSCGENLCFSSPKSICKADFSETAFPSLRNQAFACSLNGKTVYWRVTPTDRTGPGEEYFYPNGSLLAHCRGGVVESDAPDARLCRFIRKNISCPNQICELKSVD